MSFTSAIKVILTGTSTGSQDIGSASYSINQNMSLANFSDGMGLNQAQQMWNDRRTLAAGASEIINMAQPVPRDAIGQTLQFDKIKVLYVFNQGGAVLAATDILWLGGEGTADEWQGAFTGIVKVGPASGFLLCNPSEAGYAISTPGNHKLKILNSAAQPVTYELYLIGAQNP